MPLLGYHQPDTPTVPGNRLLVPFSSLLAVTALLLAAALNPGRLPGWVAVVWAAAAGLCATGGAVTARRALNTDREVTLTLAMCLLGAHAILATAFMLVVLHALVVGLWALVTSILR